MRVRQQRSTAALSRTYLLNEILSSSLYVASIFLLTRRLSPSDWGTFSTLLIFFRLLASFTSTYFAQGTCRIYHTTPDADRINLVGTMFLMTGGILALLSMPLYSLDIHLISAVFPNIEAIGESAATSFTIWLPIHCLRLFLNSIAKVQERPLLVISGNAIFHLLFLLQVIIAVRSQTEYTLHSASASLVVAECAAITAPALGILRKFKLQFQYFNETARISVPLTVASAFYTIFVQIDRIILSRYISIDALGSYNLGTLLAGFIATLSTALLAPISTRVLRLISLGKREEASATSHEARDSTIALVGIFTATLMSTANVLAPWIATASAPLFMAALSGRSIGQYGRTLQQLVQHNLYYEDRHRSVLFLNLITFASGISLCFGFTHYFGPLAASLYFPATFVLVTVLTVSMTRHSEFGTLPRGFLRKSLLPLGSIACIEFYQAYSAFAIGVLDIIQLILVVSLIYISLPRLISILFPQPIRVHPNNSSTSVDSNISKFIR